MSQSTFMKKVSITLAVAIAACSLSACQPNDQASVSSTGGASSASGSSTTQATDDGLPAVGDFSKKLKMKWYMCSDGTTYKDGNPVAEKLNEKYNVEMSTLMINGFDNDKMNVTLASGDIPDVLIRWGTQGYYDGGLIQAIEKPMIENYMPKSYEIIEDYGDSAWIYATSATDKKILGIPQISVTGDAVHTASIRQDWLDKLNLKMPTTIDEMTEVLKQFTENDPDGNGKKDTYGITIPGLHNNLLYAACPMIFGAYGVIPTFWTVDENGEVSPGVVQTGYKEALKKLADWHKAGYIDPEWVTTDNAAYQNKITNGQVGVWGYTNPGYLNYTNPTSVPSLTLANNKNAKLTYMEPLVGPSGKAAGACDGPSGSWVMSFGAKSSVDQVARAMQMAEDFNLDPEMFELTYFGIEGTTFAKNPDGSNAPISGVTPQEFGCQVFRTASLFTWENAKLQSPSNVVDLTKESTTYPSLRNVISDSAVSGTYDNLKVDEAEMSKLTAEFFFNAITGKIDIDAQWDEYVQKWMDLGGKVKVEGARTLPIIYTNK